MTSTQRQVASGPHGTLASPTSRDTRLYTSSRERNTLKDLAELWQHRDLVWMLAQRDVKIRYKQSILGIGWAILQPLSMTLIFTLVFSVFLHVKTGSGSYAIFSYVAMLPWTFFANTLTLGTISLTGNSNLLTKVYFPREVFPIGVAGACLFDFAIGSLILLGMMVFYHAPISFWLLIIPVILAIEIVFVVSLTMILSALMVFFRDLRFVVPLLLQIWLYGSPVIYSVNSVPSRFRFIYDINPMVGIIDSFRRAIIQGIGPDWPLIGTSLLFSLATLVLGYRFFKRAELLFADIV